MTKKYGYIYQIENLVNGKKYIGQTINKKGHRDFPNGYKYNIHLYRSYEKYGIESFKITIIDDARNQKKLDKKEEFYIQKFNTLNSDFGYNMRHGGSSGKLTQEHKELISINSTIFLFSKDYLEQEYLTNKKPLCQIAKENNCSTPTILRKLNEYNIPIKTQYIFLTKEFLEQEYLTNKKSMCKIADENNCSDGTILYKLRKYNILTRTTAEIRRISFRKEFLEQEYLINKKSMCQIAVENNCSDGTILRNLREYNIPTRTSAEIRRISFTKEFLEQEYLVNKKASGQIALEQNCSYTTILNKLRKNNIPIRNRK